MNRHTLSLIFLITVASVFSPTLLRADPLIIAEPTGKNAWVSSSAANVTFDVLAKGNTTLSYQWQVQTGGIGSFSNLTDSTSYSGSLTPNLTVNNTNTSLNGNKYQCFISDTAGNVTTFAVGLGVNPAPTITPSFTITPSSVPSDYTGNIVLNVTGLTSGEQVRFLRYQDANHDGQGDISDPLVNDFAVKDGNVTAFGGVTDPVLPGDDDGTKDGNISTHITLPGSAEMGKVSGNYVITVTSTNSNRNFIPITQILTVTQPVGYVQSVSGQVFDTNNNPIGYSKVALLSQDNNGDSQFVVGTLTDSSGNFTLAAPTGSYQLVAFKPGYVTASAPSITLTASQTLTGQNPTLAPATAMIVGNITDSVTPSTVVRGVQLFASNNNGGETLTTSNNDGNFVVPVTSGNWNFDLSDNSLPPLGYLRPQNKTSSNTTGNINQNVTMSLTPINALIYGTIKNGSTPLSGVLMDADDSNGNQTSYTSDANGNFYLGVTGINAGNNWNVSTDNTNPALAGFVPPSGQSFSITPNLAQAANFTTQNVTAYVNGTVDYGILNGNGIVTNGNTPVANLTLQADLQNTNNFVEVQSTTDDNGNFSLGLFGGVWNVQVNYNNNNNDNNNSAPMVIGESGNITVTDNVNINNIPFLVLNGTNQITGTVLNASNQPVTGTTVTGTANISGNNYTIQVQTDNSGNYSLPVVNGNWTLNLPNQSGYNSASVVVNNNAPTLNFSPSPFLLWQIATFGNNNANAAPLDISANDGISNLVKYAFNLSPFSNQQQNLPQAVTITNSGKNYLQLVFNATATDVTYTPQVSIDNMTTWQSSATGLVVTSCDGQVTVTYDLTGHPIAFLRVLVTLNN
jgi:hypothetical protein